ncbi:hypothetical protein VCHA34P129_150093 [Vibrio chagasii]|nr:hypothetical protein VCHA34P129_150093 [Vibrio chagasii]CAH6997686.1 hypothetical protein VCHA52P455_160094 [Vibrio chagasii]
MCYILLSYSCITSKFHNPFSILVPYYILYATQFFHLFKCIF